MEDTGARRHYPRLLVAAATVVAVDQMTKQLALEGLADGPITLIPGVLRLNLTFNSGGAFGVMKGMPGFFLVATMIVTILIAVWARSVQDRRWLYALGMVLGGGLGNVADRVFRDLDGRVVDFFDLGWWPVFNVADMAIVLGISWVIFLSIREPKPEHGEARTDR